MDNIRFGKFIAENRKLKGMTQAELAEQIGVSDKAVSKWETGRGFPDINLLEPLSHALQISVTELMQCERKMQETMQKVPEKDEALVLSVLRYARDEMRRKKQQSRLLLGFVLTVCLVLWEIFVQYRLYTLDTLLILFGFSELALGIVGMGINRDGRHRIYPYVTGGIVLVCNLGVMYGLPGLISEESAFAILQPEHVGVAFSFCLRAECAGILLWQVVCSFRQWEKAAHPTAMAQFFGWAVFTANLYLESTLHRMDTLSSWYAYGIWYLLPILIWAVFLAGKLVWDRKRPSEDENPLNP